MTRSFHAKAWLAWAAAAAVFTLAIDNALASGCALLALAVVAASFRSQGPEGRTAALFFKLGLAIIAVRVVLFGLTGHTGETTLFTLPSAGLPKWLGGFTIGGRVTGEVLAQEIAEGLKIAAFLACFGVFLASVETYRVLRMLPRFLFEAGLVVGIAITFVPSLLRSAAEIRDAQRLRGHRFRGLRSLRPLVVPVLAGALERSLTLAASMEARGFGRTGGTKQRRETLARAGVLAGLAALCAGGGFALAGRTIAGTGAAVAGAIAIGAGLRALSGAVARTRLRAERLDAWDSALIASSAGIAVLTIAARSLDAAHWYPYPAVHLPAADLRLIMLAASLALPAAIAPLRALALRAAESRHPVAEVNP